MGPDTSPFGPGSGRFLFLQIGLRSGSGSFSFSPCIVPKYVQTVNMLFPPFSVPLLGIWFFWAKSVVSACAGSKASACCERGGVVQEQEER